MRKIVTIFCSWILLLLAGSCVEPLAPMEGQSIALTLICNNAPETKIPVEGEEYYNENLFSWVDFFFFAGLDEENMVYHVRKTSGETKKALFNINVSGQMLRQIFPVDENNGVQATEAKVFVVANYPAEDETYGAGLSLSALRDLVVETDFANTEDNRHRQPHFLMSGEYIIHMSNPASAVVTSEELDIKRNVCKIAASVFLKDVVEIMHDNDPSKTEKWIPLKQDTQIYLVNGMKTVKLSGDQAEPSADAYFDYRNNPRLYVKNDGVSPYVGKTERDVTYYDTEHGNEPYTVSQTYYDSYPMYTCPQSWSQTTQEQEPYLKMIVTWYRLEENGYTPISKQYYYKILIPDDETVHEDGLVHKQQFVRNNFYHYFIDVGILGSDTDDGRVLLSPRAIIVPWEAHGQIEKLAEIGDARYLSVDRDTVVLRNISSLVQLGYTSSHAVYIDSIKATRPYYGESTSGRALGGIIKKVKAEEPIADYEVGSYYIEYDLRYNESTGKVEYWDNSRKVGEWMTDTGTSFDFQHALENNYNLTTFDYSPYTIHFRLIHQDKKNKIREERLRFSRTITVIQYPGIYIRAWANSDNTVTATPGNTDHKYTSDHWGYVLIDGGLDENRTRIRPSSQKDIDHDDFFGIKIGNTSYNTSNNQKKELQWRTVWYTGGSVNLFKIDVTVLPDEEFVIGDPRTDFPVDLHYQYIPEGDDADAKWTANPDKPYYIPPRDGFGMAPPVIENPDGTISPDPDPSHRRTLQYYYPTESSGVGGRTYNMLAPSYMIASKFGGTEYGNGDGFQNVSKQFAEYRCAAYQEDGFPAGRWRLPTRAEIRFIAKLSANKTFTFLFSKNTIYWSANGAIKVTDNDVEDSSSSSALLRCVYDTWYWGEAQIDNREQFVWGDRLR